MKKFITGLTLSFLLTSLVSTLIPTDAFAANCAGFPDITSTDPFCSGVTYVKGLGVMTGQGNGDFLPESTLTRAEAAAVLVRYLGLSPSVEKPRLKKFADADANAWYAGYFEPLLEKKIFEGYPDGSLKPGGTLNRAEWLKLFYVTNLLAGSSVEKNVSDVPANMQTLWYRPYLNDALAKGFIDLNQNAFAPGSGQKRKLVADLVFKVDNYKNYQAQSVVNVKVSDLDAVYQSRFGAEDAHLTPEASRDLAFGFNYPKNATFVWQSGASTESFALADKLVSDSQNLGKTLVGRFNFLSEVNPDNKDSFAKYISAAVERYDGDGNQDMPGLKLPIKYWQFDNDSISAETYFDLMKITYETVKITDSNAKVIQGVQHSLTDSSKNFWQKVYQLGGGSYLDAVVVVATNEQDFGVTNYKNFLSPLIGNKALWLVGVKSSSNPEQFFVSAVKALLAGADHLFWGPVDSVGVVSSTFSVNGDRQQSFFAAETLCAYLNRYSQVSSISNGASFQLGNNIQVYALFGGSVSGLQIKKGVDYLGNELFQLGQSVGLYF